MPAFKPDPHQVRAVRLMERGSTFLSWAPGVGKTWPAIVAAERTVWDGPTLAIVPAHLRVQWESKVREYSNLTPKILDGLNTPVVLTGADFFICSYEYVSNVPRWRELRGCNWTNIVLDEAHYLARQTATRTHAILGAKPGSKGALVRAAEAVWCLTGTPFTFPDEIYPILSRVFPGAIERDIGGMWPSRGVGPMTAREWENAFCVVETNNFGEKVTGAKNVPELRFRLSDVLDKVKLSDVHPGGNFVDTVTIQGDLTKLTAGLDPALLDQYQALVEILADPDIEDEDKLAELAVSGLDMAQLRHNIAVAKVQSTAELVKFELAERPGKIVVYGWHRAPLVALARSLRTPVIHGQCSPKARGEAKAAFIEDPKCRVLCGQIGAIGTGVDGLQQVAQRGIFMEQSWRYLENEQAMGRLHRRGQSGEVHHTFLSLHGSVDEHVARVMRRKAENVTRALD